MADTALPVLVYGLMAAASPLALAVTLVVLRSQRARLNGTIFALTFLAGQAAVLVTVVGLGSVAVRGHGGHDTAVALLELVLGVALLAAAVRKRPQLARRESRGEAGRTKALLDRLTHISPATSFAAGLVLGIGGPKRLTLSVLAATTIALAEISNTQALVLAVVYGLVASVLVWAPVAVYVFAGRRSQAWLAAAETWLTEHERTMTRWSMLVLGALLVGDAVGRLL